MKMPPLNALRAFEAAARLMSMSRAGNELHVTHGAVSHQIKKLELWFGCALIERAGRGIVLTIAGQELFRAVTTSFTVISATCSQLRRDNGDRSVMVACIPSIATRWLVPTLPEFTQRHPDVAVHVSYAQSCEQLDPQRHDILIVDQDTASDSAASVKIFSRTRKPVASPLYLARNPGLTRDARFDHVHLLHDELVSEWDSWFLKAGYLPRRVLNGPCSRTSTC